MADAALARIEEAWKHRQDAELRLMEETQAIIDLYLEVGPDHIDREVFSGVLKDVIDYFHLTPTELALSQYTKQSTISRWLRGASLPTPAGRNAVFRFLSGYCAEKLHDQSAMHSA